MEDKINDILESLVEAVKKAGILKDDEVVYTIGTGDTEFKTKTAKDEEELAKLIVVASDIAEDSKIINIYKNHVKISQVVVSKEDEDDYDDDEYDDYDEDDNEEEDDDDNNLVETYHTTVGNYKITLNIERI